MVPMVSYSERARIMAYRPTITWAGGETVTAAAPSADGPL